MHDSIEKLLLITWNVWKRRWLALLLAWCVAVVGWLYVDGLPSQYKASARIFVDSNRILAPLLEGLAVQPDVEERVSMMSRMLLTRPNMEKLLRMADQDVTAADDDEFEELLDETSDNIRISGSRGNSSLYSISYVHQDSDIAKRIVQSLITIFVENSLGEKRKDSESAKDFLDTQIADYERRLFLSEQRLSEFKRENAGSLPGESGGYYQRLATAETQLGSTSLELQESLNRQIELQKQVAAERPRSRTVEVATAHPLDPEISEHRRQLNELQLRYTDRHPVVAKIQQIIANLEYEKVNSPISNQVTRVPGEVNPVYQQMRALLVETEANIAQLRTRKDAYEQNVFELRRTVGSIPEVEAKLVQLNRDYDIVKSQYEVLLQRRESARLSENVEQNVDDVKFRIIDPPFVPARPSEPDKFVLNGMVPFVALGSGVAFCYLLALLNPVFFTRKSLADQLSLPVLGSVGKNERSVNRYATLAATCVFGLMLAMLVAASGFVGMQHLKQANYSLVSDVSSVFNSKSGKWYLKKIQSKIPDISKLN